MASKNIFVYTAISGAFTFQRPAAYNSSMQPIDLRVAWQYGTQSSRDGSDVYRVTIIILLMQTFSLCVVT